MVIEQTNLRDHAYAYIKKRLLNCDILPGEDISEKQIVEEIGTGRTPVREALIMLQNEALVDIIPRKATCARPITTATVREVYQMRRIMEPCAAAQHRHMMDHDRLHDYGQRLDALCAIKTPEDSRAFYRLDCEFHQYMIDCADNRILTALFHNLMQQSYRAIMFCLMQNPEDSRHLTCDQHWQMIHAVMEDDSSAILRAFTAHINHSKIVAQNALRKLRV